MVEAATGRKGVKTVLLKRIAELEERVEALENKVADLEATLQGQREREKQEWADVAERLSRPETWGIHSDEAPQSHS